MDQKTVAFARSWARRYVRTKHPHGLDEGDVQNRILIQGQKLGISPDNPDEGVWLVNAKTGEIVATATVERSDSQTIDCVFAEPPEPGTYTLVVSCRNGMRESLKPATAKVKNIVVKAE